MITRKAYRRSIWIATLLCALGEVAMGQNSGSTGPAPVVEHETARGTGSKSTLLTLEELKAAGKLRSSYRNHQQRLEAIRKGFLCFSAVSQPSRGGLFSCFANELLKTLLWEQFAASTKSMNLLHFFSDSLLVGAEAPQPELAAFRKDIQPILEKACVQCHGPDTQEGNIRIDTLDPDLLHGSDVDRWLEIVAVLSNGEMSPPDEAKLADDDRSKLIEWLSSEIQVASAVRRAEQEAGTYVPDTIGAGLF